VSEEVKEIEEVKEVKDEVERPTEGVE